MGTFSCPLLSTPSPPGFPRCFPSFFFQIPVRFLPHTLSVCLIPSLINRGPVNCPVLMQAVNRNRNRPFQSPNLSLFSPVLELELELSSLRSSRSIPALTQPWIRSLLSPGALGSFFLPFLPRCCCLSICPSCRGGCGAFPSRGVVVGLALVAPAGTRIYSSCWLPTWSWPFPAKTQLKGDFKAQFKGDFGG